MIQLCNVCFVLGSGVAMGCAGCTMHKGGAVRGQWPLCFEEIEGFWQVVE